MSAVCTEIHSLGDNRYRFDNFQIINGAQTVGSLAQVAHLDSQCEVVLRVTQGISVKTEKGFNADIILYNNTQNVVRASDFRSNDNIQLWLETKFSTLKARGALAEPIKYVRKRTHKRVRGALGLKFEDMAKIRYAWLYEPTRCIADPRSLWTPSDEGGFYESAFGVDGDLVSHWDEHTFEQALLAVLCFNEIIDKISELIKADKANFFFLRRLRFWALALCRVHIRLKQIDSRDLLASKAKFDEWFNAFWRDIFRDLIQAHKLAQESGISNFALARNESRWNNTKHSVELFLQANLG